MSASLDIIYPQGPDPVLVRARREHPVQISVGGNDTLSYGTTTALGSTLAAGATLTFFSDVWIRSAGDGPVLLRRFNEWDTNIEEASFLRAGKNPSADLHPTNPRKWAIMDFIMVTDKGTGNRLHTRSLALHQHGDPAEIVFTRSGPDNSPAYGDGTGTDVEAVESGSGLGFITWQGLIDEGSFQGHAARIGCRLLEDSRQDALTVTLANEVTLPQDTIEITGDMDDIEATDGETVIFEDAGRVSISGNIVTYAGRDSNTLFGCEGGTGTIAAGTNVRQTQTRQGGTIRLHTSSLGTAETEHKFQVDHDGSCRVGELAIAANAPNFFTVRGGRSRFQSVTNVEGLTGTVIGTPGTSTYTYYVVGRTAHGGSTLSQSVEVTSAPDTLNGSNYIRLNWDAPNAGVVAWDVVRSASTGSPATTGAIIRGQPFYNGNRAVDNGKAIVAQNEQQSIAVISADGGTYTLEYDGQVTDDIAYNATAAEIDTALEALSNIDPGDVTVTASSANSVLVEFTGALAGTNVVQMIPDATNLTQSDVDADPPLIDLRTRQVGGPTSYTQPTRNSTADVTVDGELTASQSIVLPEQSADPDAPAVATQGKLYAKDSSNRTTLHLRDSTGIKNIPDSVGAFTFAGNQTFSGNVEIDGALNHDGTTVGFYDVTPATRPAAYTQTYATATRTHSNPTATALTDSTGQTPDTTIANVPDPADTPADADALREDLVANVLPVIEANISDLTDAVNKLIVDVANTKQVLNQVIDDDQTVGLKQ